ncbi:flavodoxin domain-containing protein [endosymbiont 'TC1' of Trimyema compressum]|uniref:flavodoxin domain-containing protein n=1 Tax=endosymbiont 'TC1' of Trimyema compressum TaxID=243899 RepID=UPI000A467F67|nr:flavodoxin domain-containing protein [endosymbiont 'TC1' of Trimyema compressum]
MKTLTIIYWSGTGNTETMAMTINEAAKAKGYESVLKSVENATLEDVKKSNYLAFGCPAMGAEELEDEMESFMNNMTSSELIKNKKPYYSALMTGVTENG